MIYVLLLNNNSIGHIGILEIFVVLSFCGFNTFPYMVIPLIIRNWLELDMSNVLLLDRKSYIKCHLSVSTDLSYV